MKDSVYKKMIETPGGGISSTRVMAWSTWQFTWKFMIGCFLLFAMLFSFDGLGWMELDVEVFNVILKIYLWTVGILLVAIYTPKTIGKFAESWGMMGMNKNGKA